ncbi:phage tail protein [Persephonella sp.]
MIADWLWEISPTSFKTGNKEKTERDVYKLYQVWESNIENFRQHAFTVRKQRFPQLASPNALYLLGKERGFNRFKSETAEEFRNRVINAIPWYEKAGTVKGIKEILALYGFENVKITPVLQTDPNRWAEFRVETTSERQINAETAQLVIDIVNKLKPTHEKLKELILSYLAKANVYISSSTMGESTAYSEMITGFKWTSSGTAFVYSGSMGEVSVTATMVEA